MENGHWMRRRFGVQGQAWGSPACPVTLKGVELLHENLEIPWKDIPCSWLAAECLICADAPPSTNYICTDDALTSSTAPCSVLLPASPDLGHRPGHVPGFGSCHLLPSPGCHICQARLPPPGAGRGVCRSWDMPGALHKHIPRIIACPERGIWGFTPVLQAAGNRLWESLFQG